LAIPVTIIATNKWYLYRTDWRTSNKF